VTSGELFKTFPQNMKNVTFTKKVERAKVVECISCHFEHLHQFNFWAKLGLSFELFDSLFNMAVMITFSKCIFQKTFPHGYVSYGGDSGGCRIFF